MMNSVLRERCYTPEEAIAEGKMERAWDEFWRDNDVLRMTSKQFEVAEKNFIMKHADVEGLPTFQDALAKVPLDFIRDGNCHARRFASELHRMYTAHSNDSTRSNLWGVYIAFKKYEGEDLAVKVMASTDGRRLLVHEKDVQDGDMVYAESAEAGVWKWMDVNEADSLAGESEEWEKGHALVPLPRSIARSFGIDSQEKLDETVARLNSEGLAMYKNSLDKDFPSLVEMCNGKAVYCGGDIWNPDGSNYPNFWQVIPAETPPVAHGAERIVPYVKGYARIARTCSSSDKPIMLRIDEEHAVCVNADYLLDGLECLGDGIAFKSDGHPYSPIVLASDKGLYLLMPLKGKGGPELDLRNLDDLPAYENDAEKTAAKPVKAARAERRQERKAETTEAKQEQKTDAMDRVFELTDEARQGLCEVKKYINYYGQKYENMRKIDFINMLFKEGKCSAKTYPKKDGKGVWKIACDTLFDEDCFRYALYLLSGGKMIEIPAEKA